MPHDSVTTVYSDPQFDPDARAKPGPGEVLALRGLRTYYEANPPGYWSEDRWRQVQHFKSVPYIAIRAIMDLVSGSSFDVLRRVRNPKGKTTFAAGTVAKSSAHGQQTGRDEDYAPFDDYDHPIARLVRKPNDTESMGEFVAKLVLQNRLTGVGPVWALGGKANPEKPVELWTLRTPFLQPHAGYSERFPRGAWRVLPYMNSAVWGGMPMRMGAGGATVPGEEVKRFVDPHPYIDWDGWSPLSAGAVQMDVYDAIELSRKSAFDNGLGIDTVITIPGADESQVDRFKEKTQARHGGAQNAGKTAYLGVPVTGSGDKPTILPLAGRSAKDMDYQAGWDQTVRFILALFGVPDSIVGLKTAGSYAEAYAARQQFYDRQEDYLNRLAVWFDREFLDPWEEYPDEFTFRIKPKPIQDKEFAEKQHARQCQHGTITYNESRAKDDLPPVEGGDVPVSVYVEQQTQKHAADRREPQLPSGAPDLDKQDDAAPANKPLANREPRPGNPAAKGSLAPRPEVGKAMSSQVGSEGGFLVAPAVRKRKRRRYRAVVAKALKALESE